MVKNDVAKVEWSTAGDNTVLNELPLCIDEMKAENVKAVDAILCSIHAHAYCSGYCAVIVLPGN